jgi:hypothetical protein
VGPREIRVRRSRLAIAAAVSAVMLLTALGLYMSGVLHAKNVVDPAWVHLSSATDDLPAPGASREQTAALVSDLDGDGRNDFVIGMRRQAPALVWYRRGVVGWTRHVIEPDMLPIEAGGAAGDIDGDGDLDLVMGEDYQGGNVYWWENPLPAAEATRPWQRRVVKSSSANQHHDAAFGDLDDDGRGELAFWNQQSRTLFLADPPADVKGAGPWPLVSVFESDTTKIEGLAVADVDGDGQRDLIGGGRWFKHRGGERYVAEVIDDSMRFGRVAAGQLVPGGRPEMVFAAGDLDGPLRWYEWDGSRWVRHALLEDGVRHGHSLAVADVDRDGHLDIFVAEMHTPGAGDSARALVFYGDGRGTFRKQLLARGLGNHESRIADRGSRRGRGSRRARQALPLASSPHRRALEPPHAARPVAAPRRGRSSAVAQHLRRRGRHRRRRRPGHRQRWMVVRERGYGRRAVGSAHDRRPPPQHGNRRRFRRRR